jgi:hypothetical protein
MKNPKEEHKSLMEKLKPLQEQWQRDMLKTLQEPKQETLEEASKEYVNKNYTDYAFKKVLESIFIAGAKWQQERMYSEEDLREAYIAGCKNPLLYKTHEEKAIDWYKQYKK